MVWRGQPAALWWGLATFMVIVLPLLLLAGVAVVPGPQLMPTPLFRVLMGREWFVQHGRASARPLIDDVFAGLPDSR